MRQKSSDIFRRAFFGNDISGEALLVYNFVPSNWLWSGFINPPPPFGFFSFPRKESFDLNRKKKAPKKRTRFGRKFPPEWAKISSRSISRDYFITSNRATFFARESCSKIPLPKKALQKIDFCLKNSPLRRILKIILSRDIPSRLPSAN